MTPHTLLNLSAAAWLFMFLLNCFVCYRNIKILSILTQPNYRHHVLTRTDQLHHDILKQKEQRNFCFINIAIMVLCVLPLLYAMYLLN